MFVLFGLGVAVRHICSRGRVRSEEYTTRAGDSNHWEDDTSERYRCQKDNMAFFALAWSEIILLRF